MLEQATFSPAQPWRLLHPPALSLSRQPFRPRTCLVPGKAAASHHFIRGGWNDPNCARPTRAFLSRALREHGDRPSYPASFFSSLSELHNRIDHQLKPGRDGFLSVPLFVLTVPYGKRHGLHPAGNQLGFVLLLFTHQRSAHDDMPDSTFPRSFPLDTALLLFGRQGTKAPSDEILDRRDPARNDFKRPHTVASFLGGLGGSAIDIALPVCLPMPDIDVVIELAHAEKRGSIAERQSDRDSVAKGSRRQTVVLRVVLPFKQKRDLGAVVERPNGQGSRGRLRPDRPGNDLTAQRKRHRRDLSPGGILGPR